MKIELSKFLSYSILLLTISSVNHWSSFPIGNTYFWWIVCACILFAFGKARKTFYNNENNKNLLFLFLYLSWNIVCIIRGFFVAENYWEWKNLIGTSMVLLLPITINVSTNKFIVQQIIGTWIKYALPAFFLFLPLFNYGDAIGRYLAPISFILIFLPFVPNKWKYVIIAFALFVILGALDARSNVIKFGFSLILGLLFYFKPLITKNIFFTTRFLFLVIPIILFSLAVTDNFNIFKMDEYLSGDHKTNVVANGELKEEDLTADTRTGIYEEVLSSAIANDYVITGRTPARGNDSELFGLVLAEELQTGKMERFSNEVSILNIFTWTGLIGVIFYFLIFYQASYLAVHKSNSLGLKLLGLYVSFRWTYAWVEDFSEFDLSYFFLWIMIGMCFSKSFRNMNDIELKNWIRGVFVSNYEHVDNSIFHPKPN